MAANTFVISKQHFTETKQFPRSLSQQKLVYARDEDPEDTFIIRSFYGGDKFAVFGVKGCDSIHAIFLSILKLMQMQEEVLRNKTQYVDDKHFDDVANIWKELSSSAGDELSIRTENSKSKSNNKLFFIHIDTSPSLNVKTAVRVGMMVDFKHPKISLFNYINDEVASGIYLYIGEAMKLLNYINNRFNFVSGAIAGFLRYRNSVTDDFF